MKLTRNAQCRSLQCPWVLRAVAATVVMGVLVAPTAVRAQPAPQTLIVAAPQTPTGFDGDIPKVATRQMIVQANESLVRFKRTKAADGRTTLDPTGVEPNLAESWTVSPDGKTYVFKLRQGVKSPWGNEMTADDIVWSFERAWSIKRTSFFLYNLIGLETFKKTGPYEVTLGMKNPSRILLPMLTMYFPTLHDKTQVLKNATADDPWALKWIDQNTAGFGAYHLQSLKSGEEAVFVANPNYFGGKPFYDRVVYKEVPNAGTRFTLMRSGQVQWTEELTLRQISELKKDKRVKIESDQGTGHASVRMNPTIKPFDNPLLRQAILYATDYQALNRAVFENLGTQAKSIVPPVIPGADTSAWKFDTNLERARQLLKQAGYADGIDITLEYAAVFWFEEQLAIQMKDQLAKAGIRVKLQKITDADMRSRTAPNKRDLGFFTFQDNPIILDPVYALYLNAHTQGVSNRNNYSNPEFNKLIDAARIEQNARKRLDLVRRAQQIHTADATWVMTMYPGSHEAMAPCITGYVWQPDYHERWRELSCRK